MAEQYSVRVSLIIKTDSAAEARKLAVLKLADTLNGWMAEDNGREAPYPSGSLLWWGTLTPEQLTGNDNG